MRNTIIEVFVYKYSETSERNETRVLESMGFKTLLSYDTQVLDLVRNVNLGNIDTITFTSPPSVRGLFNFAKRHGNPTKFT